MKNSITQYLSPVLTSSLYVEINPVIKHFDQAVHKQLITAWNRPQQAANEQVEKYWHLGLLSDIKCSYSLRAKLLE